MKHHACVRGARLLSAPLLIVLLLGSACSSDADFGGSAVGGTPGITSGFAPSPSEASDVSTGTRWLESPPVVLGVGPARVALRRLNQDALAVGVDALGGFTTLSATNADVAKSQLVLERFAHTGALSWRRAGLCNGPLIGGRLFVDPRGQSLFATAFSGTCLWEGSSIDSTVNPEQVAQSFDQFSMPVPSEVKPSLDVMLMAHSDEGQGRGFAQFGGAGDQLPGALVASPDAVGVLLSFQATATLVDQELTSSAGGAGADQVWAQAFPSPVNRDAASALAQPLEFGAPIHFVGENISQVVARPSGLLLGGAGPLPAVAKAAPATTDSEYGWIAALNAETELEWAARFRPAVAPRSLLQTEDGSIYAAFDVMGVEPQLVAESELTGAPEPEQSAIVNGFSILKLSGDGRLAWRRDFASGLVLGVDLAATNDRVSLWGTHDGSVTIDGVVIATDVQASADALIMTLDSEGALISALHWGLASAYDAALAPQPHPAGGFIGLLRLGLGDVDRGLDFGTYVLRIPG